MFAVTKLAMMAAIALQPVAANAPLVVARNNPFRISF